MSVDVNNATTSKTNSIKRGYTQDRPRPRSRPVSAIISTTHTNVISQGHLTIANAKATPTTSTTASNSTSTSTTTSTSGSGSGSGSISASNTTPNPTPAPTTGSATALLPDFARTYSSASLSHLHTRENNDDYFLNAINGGTGFQAAIPPLLSRQYHSSKDRKDNRTRSSSDLREADGKQQVELQDQQEIEFIFTMYRPTTLRTKALKSSTLAEKLDYVKPYLPHISQDQELNVQIHLFLSTIMVKYVNSWYLTKLTTPDNTKFVRILYDEIIVVLAADIVSRCEKLDAVKVCNDLGFILNQHLEEFMYSGYGGGETGDSKSRNGNERDGSTNKVIEDYRKQAKCQNSAFYDSSKSGTQILDEYLARQHIAFDPNFDNDQESIVSDNNNATKTPPHLIYFREMMREILETVFNKQELSYKKSNAVFSSKIGSDLLVLILADLVLNKAFERLSSPTFILHNINKVVNSLLRVVAKPQKKKHIPMPLGRRIRRNLGRLYQVLITIADYSLLECETPSINVFDCFIFQLLANMVALYQVRPLLYYLFASAQLVIKSLNPVNNWINHIFSIWVLEIMKDLYISRKLAYSINLLRLSLFYENGERDSDDEEEGGGGGGEEADRGKEKGCNGEERDMLKLSELSESQRKTDGTDIVTENIFTLIQHLPLLQSKPRDTEKHRKEKQQQQRNTIKQVLTVFAENMDIDPNHKVNKFFVLKIIDYIVHNLYNEI
ncbi:hypothetical protein PVL30_001500 [Lodderomyces elongisporus]|uniref:uncharacterized protein n=1 Tax=Lodderomyces elongisporus TaxID=36914 RepID=UPI002922660A|nr:uncharacterized protein PVL30_001500 [Lodderomyces elongisporus]WLF77780.1 hypothetical protein PVL30_001500 [Lodderomyces elongisporus]